MKIQNEVQLGLGPNEMLWKLNVDHISFSGDTTFFLLSNERVACWWKEAPSLEGRVAPAVSLRALGLLSCMSHLEGGLWGWIRAFPVVGWEAYFYAWSPLVSWACETVWTWSCSPTELELRTLGTCSYYSRGSGSFTWPTRHRTSAVLLFSCKVLEERKLLDVIQSLNDKGNKTRI